MPETDVKGRVVLVTGASSGIGQATAVEMASRGWHVAITYFSNEKGAQDTLQRLRPLTAQASAYGCDVSDPGQVTEMSQNVLRDFGRIDALVNNAGSLLERRSLTEMDYDLWRRVMGLNLDSVFLVTRAFLSAMIGQHSGNIVNVASIAGRNGGGPGAAAYSTAKGGLMTLTKSMAKELMPLGIRVNAINPGVIWTPFHERFSTREMLDRFVAATPRQRLGTSEEMAKIIAFLLSDDSAYLVGECIEANGGILMD